MHTIARSYDRAPSTELQSALLNGPLVALLGLGKRKVQGCHLDVHLRRKEEVHVYCGRTKLVTARLVGGREIRVSAHKTYSDQDCGRDLFGAWSTDRSEEQAFETALTTYLDNVSVGRQWIDGEGLVQTAWSRVTEPWVPFDREAVLAYESTNDAKLGRTFERVKMTHAAVDEIATSGKWAKTSESGGEVDQLAVDPAGRLVIVELKDASKSDVYYAPIQLLQYVWEWHSVFPEIRGSLQELLTARVGLGLSPASVPKIGEGIRAVVGFGADERSDEVKRRYAKVVEVANAHLPDGVPAIETWALGPTRCG